MAYSANKTTLSYRIGNSGSFTLIPNLREVPEFGGTPEKIDVTTLKDKSKKFIPGIRDYGELTFSFLYDNSTSGNYRTLKGLSERERGVTFQLTYPDGTAHEFRAIPAVKMDAGTINGALTFTATMLLQGGIEVTNEGGEVLEPVVLPDGLLKSRILTADEYTVEPGGVFRTETIKSVAFDGTEMWEDGCTRNRFRFFHGLYGNPAAWDEGGATTITPAYPVITHLFGHAAMRDRDTWEWGEIAIPSDAADIENIVFDMGGYGNLVSARTIQVEPLIADGFHTFRIFGEFEVDARVYGGDLNVVAYSIIIGARPNRDGTSASLLSLDAPGCCNSILSGVRFELLSGAGDLMIDHIGMAAAAAENTFVRSRKHFIAFKEPLEKDDRVSISAKITTTKHRAQSTDGGPHVNSIVTIAQPIVRDFLRQGHAVQDSSLVTVTESSDLEWWEDGKWGEQGLRILSLSSEGLTIETGVAHQNEWSPYANRFRARGATTWDIDITEIEVISRT